MRTADQVAALAHAGRHPQAIALASDALGREPLPTTDRLALLDLRAESHLAQGDIAAAGDDAQAMHDLARRARKPAFRAQALARRAYVEIRSSQSAAAVDTAREALAAARLAKDRALEATALLRLGEAQFRMRDSEAAARTSAQAARMFKALGLPLWQGRAMWGVSAARSAQGRGADTDRAAHEALALARRSGDPLGVGNALNMLTFYEVDIAKRMALLREALAAFEAAGYVERQGVVTHNLGLLYFQLGLYHRARRLLRSAIEIYTRTRAGGLALSVWMLTWTERALGHTSEARAYAQQAIDLWKTTGGATATAQAAVASGLVAQWDGDRAAARSLLGEGERLVQGTDHLALAMMAAIGLSNVLLEDGDPAGSLAAIERAIAVHRANGGGEVQGVDTIWMLRQYVEALRANGRDAAARRALATAYRHVVEPIARLTDEGLRRNYLSKVEDNREIVLAALAERARRPRTKRRPAHLTGAANLREPFERLVDTGLRLNELRSSAELHEFLIDEATELSGAERVLLVLETSEGPRLAGSLVPAGEDASALLQAVAADLDRVRSTRVALLAYAPEGADELAQRSRVIAPLIARKELLGFLYADLDGAFGRFHDSDRDLLGMLASQAAVALDNAQWSQGLEQKVAERTEALQSSNALLEQRAGELALINSIQQGMAAKLDFQGIVDLVGDKLRTVFGSEDLSIRWWDPEANTSQNLYCIEHGRPLPRTAPQPLKAGGPAEQLLRSGVGGFYGSHAEQVAAGILGATPGTDWCLSIMAAPIRGSRRVLGHIVIENHEREHAYGEAELRVLTTIGATMGVALENARLFDETQRLLAETEQRNAELAVINSIQEGMSAEPRLRGDRRPRRRQAARGIRDGRHADPLARSRPPTRCTRSTATSTGVRLDTMPVADQRPIDRFLAERRVLVANTRADLVAHGLGIVMPGTDAGLCLIGVAIVAGDRVLGSIILENYERESAFGDAEVRLLSTVAASMGIALENARLFDETQRLLQGDRAAQRRAGADQQHPGRHRRRARLPGDRRHGRRQAARGVPRPATSASAGTIRRRTCCTTCTRTSTAYACIRIRRHRSRRASGHDWSRRGNRSASRPAPTTTRRACALVPGTDQCQSSIHIPMLGSERVLGMISLENFERENAFGDAEVRLLTTVASSMGVALENARLFDETQRLLKETEQRSAELAIINAVQQALAGELDIQGVYDAVGDKLREVFPRSLEGIRVVDRPPARCSFPTASSTASACIRRRSPLSDRGLGAEVIRTGATLLLNENVAEAAARLGSTGLDRRQPASQVDPAGAAARGRADAGDHRPQRHGARARVQPGRRPPAGDARRQHERRAAERATLRRNAAPVQGERAARGRARDHQRRPGRGWRPSSTSRASTTPSATRSARSSATATSAYASTTPTRT